MRQEDIVRYYKHGATFIHHLLPSEAVLMPTRQVMYILEKKFGDAFYQAMNPGETVKSPVSHNTDGTWLKKTKMVGINVRTIENFWNVIKYALTLPETQNSIHLLPIWEPGVVASLYGMSSWNINPEFFSFELNSVVSSLDTVEKQLKVVVNILHLMGKSVGLDVIPHTDRFSEQVLANPGCFEWLKRRDTEILAHENNLHLEVQDRLFDYFRQRNTPNLPATSEMFFSKYVSEEERLYLMFGYVRDYEGRRVRREKLMDYLLSFYFETVPATMGPPYRGLKVLDGDGDKIIDEKGRVWRDYGITKPEKFSRVFGPLTRYKLYENKNNNAGWQLDFNAPVKTAWEYAAEHYADIQKNYNFDFMRGDMAHVQMYPCFNGDLPANHADTYYDLLGYIKKNIQKQVPYFASFAETFLAPDGEMAYGNEVAHLENAFADTTLGDLQSMVVGSKRFMSEWVRYMHIAETEKVTPCFTIITGDKDDPRFDAFYTNNNTFRLFFGLFFTNMPSYMSLGFEQRDLHEAPAPNEYYTKLYVFKISEGEKATHGKYIFGNNYALFEQLDAIKIFSEQIGSDIRDQNSTWLTTPDASLKNKIVAWFVPSVSSDKNGYIFVVNLNIENDSKKIKIPIPPALQKSSPKFLFSTYENSIPEINLMNNFFVLEVLAPEECFAFEV